MLKKIVVCAAAVMLAAVSANAAELSVKYDQESRELSFSGNLTQSGRYVVITVLPSGTDRENTQVFENIAVKAVKPDKEGNFSDSVILPASFAGNEYNLYASSGTTELSKSFIHINEGDASVVLSSLRGLSKDEFSRILRENSMDLGISEAKLTEYGNELVDYLFVQQPINGYSVAEFSKATNRIYGIISVGNGADWIEMLAAHQNDFGVNIEKDFYPIGENAKALVKEAIAACDIYNIDFSSEFKKFVILAEVQCADSYGDLRDIMEKHMDSIEPDTSYYDKLDEYYKGYTFELMYEKDLKSYGDVKDEFEAAAKKAYDKKNAKDDKKSGGSSGGGGDKRGDKGFSSVPKAAAQPVQKQTDLDGHWAKDAMTELKKLGILSGYPDGTYRPDSYVTRAEFIKILAEAFKIEKSDTVIFGDTPADEWYTPYISGAYHRAIARGSGNSFCPNELITREDAAVLLARCMGISGGSTAFDDGDEIADYAFDAVAALADGKILQGSGGRFMPKKNTTRAESAQMIFKALRGNDTV